MMRILANALLAGLIIGPAAAVLSADMFGPAVDERLVLIAPAGAELLHPAMDLVGTDEYPLQLLPADSASLLHTGRFEPDATTTFLPAVILESDVAHGEDCQPHLLRVAEVDTDSGRFGIVLAPDESPAALGAVMRLATGTSHAGAAADEFKRSACETPSAV